MCLKAQFLAPYCFLLFVNDINDVISSQLLQFADDHSIVRPICNEHNHNILQQDIQNIFQWTVLNKLPLNLSKCTVMHMTRSKSPNFCSPYFMGTVRLEEVDNFKLLGVTFSKDLSFDSQVGAVSDKISKLSGFIIRCTKNMSSAALQSNEFHKMSALVCSTFQHNGTYKIQILS